MADAPQTTPAPLTRRADGAPPRLLFVVTEDWFFLSHRLPMARAAQAAGFEVHVATNVADGGAAIAREGFVLHPMRFARGSHRWGLQELSDFYGQDHAAQRAGIRIPEGEKWQEVPALLPPGGVSFHHHLTYHASGPNLTAEPRRSFAIHLRTERSRPVNDARQGLTAFIDDPAYCPVICSAG